MQAFTFIYLLFSKWICKFFFKGRSLQNLSKIFAGSTVTCYLSNTFNTNFARFVILQFSRVLNNSHVKALSPIYTGCYFSIANISFTFLVTANSDSSVSNSFLNTSASLESSWESWLKLTLITQGQKNILFLGEFLQVSFRKCHCNIKQIEVNELRYCTC